MQGVNLFTGVGNATRDPNSRTLPSGTAVCDWGMAINQKWKTRDGQPREEVCFIDCTAFGPLADLCMNNIQKGAAVLVTGRLRYEQWDASDGTRRSRHTITADQVRFFGRPTEPVDRGAPAAPPASPPEPAENLPF